MSLSTQGQAAPRWQSTGFRWTVFVVGLIAVAVVVLLGSKYSPGSLDWPLLLLLLDAVVVGMLCGPIYGVVVAILSAVGVLYFVAYPVRHWKFSNAADVVSLVVFVAVGIGLIIVVALATKARDAAARANARARVLASVVDADTTPDVTAALARIRLELDLDQVVLVGPSGGASDHTVASVGATPTGDLQYINTVVLPGSHELLGRGRELVGDDREFFDDLAAATYRAYDTQRLQEEQQRSRLFAEADAARAAVLAAVGHDLRTPLSGLRVALEGMHIDRAALSPDEFDELLDTADRSTRRLDELISNLMDLSRLQAGVLPVAIESVDVSAIIAIACADVASDSVSVQFHDSLPLVASDAALLERVVANLLSNAIRHSPEKAAVEVETTIGASSVVIHVIDHGRGLSQAERDQLLVGPLPGHRPADGGSGLGFAIVRQFTATLGGSLALAETPGGGLTVSVGVPFSEEGGLA